MLEFNKNPEIKKFEQFKQEIKILVLDDDKVILHILEELFKDVYFFKSAETIKDFKNEIADFMPDIALIDVQLPDGNGIDLCRELRSQKEYAHLNIIIVTSREDNKSIRAAYTAGANDYIRKPFISFEIYSKISQIAKAIKADNQILKLYKYQKELNIELYNFAQLINKNMNIKSKAELISSLLMASKFIKCDYVEVALANENINTITEQRYYKKTFKEIGFNKIKEEKGLKVLDDQVINFFEFANKDFENIYCIVNQIFLNKKKEGYLILERSTPFLKGSTEMLSLYLDFVNILGVDIFTRDMMKSKIHKGRSDLAKVRTIQVSLLPHFDEVEKYDIASSFIPMEEVSGDFFDGFYTHKDVYQVMLCDVSGHGIASSYVGSSIRSILRTAAKEIESVSGIMNYLNNEIVNNLANIYYFSTIVLCRLNIVNGDVAIVSGGHPPCFYYSSENNNFKLIKNTGPLVGLIGGAKYDEIILNMKDGDCLFLYTDGVTEAPSQSGEMFGEKRLYQLFQQNIEKNSIDLVHSILGTLYEYTGYTSMDDDITMICIKRNC